LGIDYSEYDDVGPSTPFEAAKADYRDGYAFSARLQRCARWWPWIVAVWFVGSGIAGPIFLRMESRNWNWGEILVNAVAVGLGGAVLLKTLTTTIHAQLDTAAATRAMM
jgi:hypothetical protein